ncbi:MAG: hypothetical protein IJ003_02180 [Candidatus Gastranaerophilales bacterium]|nr:hypothetical protein [Candidatus Gastranaerophilales bacterium]
MKVVGKIIPAFSQTMQKVKNGATNLLTKGKSIVKKAPNYAAVKLNGIVMYVPAEKIPKGAEILTTSLTSGADIIAQMNKGLINKL